MILWNCACFSFRKNVSGIQTRRESVIVRYLMRPRKWGKKRFFKFHYGPFSLTQICTMEYQDLSRHKLPPSKWHYVNFTKWLSYFTFLNSDKNAWPHTGAKTNFLSRNYQEFDVWKMRLWKCEFCEKWDFENVNFVKNQTLKLWILLKLRFWKCEFCEKWDLQNVNFWINWGFSPQCGPGLFSKISFLFSGKS